MSDFVSVDVAHLSRLSQEFRDSATALRARIQEFEAQTANTNGAYGETPNAAEAEREYQATARETLARLEKMHGDLLATAGTLDEQARMYDTTAHDAEHDVDDLNRSV